MPTKYFGVLTKIGEQKLAQALASGQPLEITQLAVGDGGGSVPTPDPRQTALLGEKRRAPINSLSIDKNNASWLIAEQVIPESDGDFWIRELGLFDAEGDLIAMANCPASYKPTLAQGSGKVQTIRMRISVSSSAAVTLKIDPAVVLASRAYVDSQAESKLAKAQNGADIPNNETFRKNIEVAAYLRRKIDFSGLSTETYFPVWWRFPNNEGAPIDILPHLISVGDSQLLGND